MGRGEDHEPTQLTLDPNSARDGGAECGGQALLLREGSVFQYYELISAQWPVQPAFHAFGGGAGSAPESILFKAPGASYAVYLVNTTMESYFQAGDQVAGPLEEDDRLPAGNFADGAREPVTPDRTRVFGTESCVGCHFSAGAVVGFKTDENGRPLVDASGRKVPIYGKNGNFGRTGHAGYVWQLQLKARSRQPVQAAR
jgi:mono/diheme cytochrome c family protein